MVWLDIITTATNGIGMSFEYLVVFVLTLGSLLFIAKDFKLGMIALFVSMAGVFIWFYEVGLNWSIPLTLLLITLVVMAFTIFATDKTSATGGIA